MRLRDGDRDAWMSDRSKREETRDRFTQPDADTPAGRGSERDTAIGERSARPDRPIPTVRAGVANVAHVRQCRLTRPRTEADDESLLRERDVGSARSDTREREQRPKSPIEIERELLNSRQPVRPGPRVRYGKRT